MKVVEAGGGILEEDCWAIPELELSLTEGDTAVPGEKLYQNICTFIFNGHSMRTAFLSIWIIFILAKCFIMVSSTKIMVLCF